MCGTATVPLERRFLVVVVCVRAYVAGAFLKSGACLASSLAVCMSFLLSAVRLRRIYEILPSQIQRWQSSPCVGEESNKRTLERLRHRQTGARQRIDRLDRKHRELDTLLERARQIPVDHDFDVGVDWLGVQLLSLSPPFFVRCLVNVLWPVVLCSTRSVVYLPSCVGSRQKTVNVYGGVSGGVGNSVGGELTHTWLAWWQTL